MSKRKKITMRKETSKGKKITMRIKISKRKKITCLTFYAFHAFYAFYVFYSFYAFYAFYAFYSFCACEITPNSIIYYTTVFNYFIGVLVRLKSIYETPLSSKTKLLSLLTASSLPNTL